MNGIFGSQNVDHRFERNLDHSVSNVLPVSEVQNSIASLEDASSILVFGASLADELPIVFLRVRKAWFKNGAKVIVAHDGPTDADSFAHLLLRYKPGTQTAVANGLLALLVAQNRVNVPGPTADALRPFTPEFVEQTTGVPADKLREAADLAFGSPIITTRSIYNLDGGSEAVETLAGLAMCSQGTFNNYGLHANSEGATLLRKPGGLNTHQILEAAAEGTIKSLWLVNVDPFALYPDRDLVQRALENVEFLVYQGVAESEAIHYASVVLPQCAPAEMEGTYTNVERRVQRMKQVLPVRGECKPAWKIYTEISVRLRPSTPLFNPGEVMEQIASEHPSFEGARYSALPSDGFLIS
jgi:predicted molibdopterin-dependent oxidoreductase YjgC